MDLFDILEIPKESSETDIKKAYRRLARKWHPDRNKKKKMQKKNFNKLIQPIIF